MYGWANGFTKLGAGRPGSRRGAWIVAGANVPGLHYHRSIAQCKLSYNKSLHNSI